MISEVRVGATGPQIYTLTLLSLVAFLNFYDRTLFSILVEPIKTDLDLSDAEIGLLAGPVFAAAYVFLSIPIARVADRGKRVGVLTWSLGAWSVMTASCGLASNFWTMALSRLGVGAGEAGGSPNINAITADIVPRERLTSALAVIVVMSNLGAASALFLGGPINDWLGWRAVFLIGGTAGMILALTIRLTLPEPAGAKSGGSGNSPSLSTAASLRMLWKRRSFVLLCCGFGAVAIGIFSFQAWVPALLMRKFGLSASDVGTTYGAIQGVTALASPLLVGLIADGFARRDPRFPVVMLIVLFCLAVPVSVAFFAAGSYDLALLLAVPANFILLAFTPLCFALIQVTSGPRLRSTGAAVSSVVIFLVGLGVGPPLVGWMSDRMGSSSGAVNLQNALILSSSAYLIGSLLFAFGVRSIAADIEEAERF